jgi:hypothetical protein
MRSDSQLAIGSALNPGALPKLPLPVASASQG